MQSIREQRRDQTDPTLDAFEIERVRVRPFGDLRSFRAGEPLQTMGQSAAGLTVIVAGKVEVTERKGGGEFSDQRDVEIIVRRPSDLHQRHAAGLFHADILEGPMTTSSRFPWLVATRPHRGLSVGYHA